MNDQIAKIRDHFLAALERRGLDAQLQYAAEYCADSLELRSKLEDMLRAHHQSGGFLASRCDATQSTQPLTEAPGTVIGPYRLIEQIGEGGMGVVWMAQQTEPVNRVVALKLVKAGMDSRQVIARFEAERQALALMDHANIARVLEAGTTSTGRPYFVMDLVKGVPITRYCDEHHLTPRERLELFIPVCQAVQHAHQKGIIHRDLKPSNVLVALYDGKPVPKVIDFGVAKAAGQSLTDKTLVTGFGAIVGTLEYMSPEQAEINQLDIDTRSDIYSLGVLLYELLTGSPPFTMKELEKAGMLEMLRVIREQEPTKPSTKLSAEQGLPALANKRGTEPAKLTKLVRGELDWIVMKALEKDRNRRYETANGFATDVQRHLADEPVEACPPSAGYRFRKLVRRNKRVLASLTVLAVSLVLTVVVLAISNVWVTQERDRTTEALRDKEAALKRETAALAKAEAEAARVRAEEKIGRHYLYTAHLTMADEAYQRAHLGQALQLLEGERPAPGREDLRGFEWYHLWYLCHQGHCLTLRGHQNTVRAVAFSPDGKTLATGSVDATVKLWASDSGRELATLRGHKGAVHSVAFSPNGKSLVSGGANDCAIVWDIPSGRQLVTLQGKSVSIMALAFSPDGKTLAAGGHANNVDLWDVATWQIRKALIETAGDAATSSLAFSPDGQTLALASGYRQLQLWDVATGHVRTTLNGHRWFARCVAFSPDGKKLASAASDELPVKVWDVATAELERTFQGHTEPVFGLAFSPDAKKLASAGEDGTLKVWDMTTGQSRTFAHLGPVRCVAFSPDGKRLVSGSGDRTVKLWDMDVEQKRPSLEARNGAIWSVAFSPDSSTLASANGNENGVALWDLASRQLRTTLLGHSGNPTCVIFSADGKMLASGGSDQTVRLWDLSSGQTRATLRGHKGNVHALAFSRDGRTLASSGNDGVIKLWDTASGEERAALEAAGPERAALKGSRKWVYSLVFSHDGQTLAAAGRDGIVRLWDVASNRERVCLDALAANQDSLALSPDGKVLAALITPDAAVKFWDLTSGQQRAVIGKRAFSRRVHRLAFSPDWKTVAVGSCDGVVLWDVTTERDRVTLKWPTDEVLVLAFSPDGRLLATGGWDGSVALWPTATEHDVIAQSSSEQTGR